MKHQALFYTFCIVGLVVLILLGFTLYLGWPALMTLAPIILFVGGAALCALIVIGVVFTGFMAFSHGRRHYFHTNRFLPNESNGYSAYLAHPTQTLLTPAES